jgi:hypothetical protein
MPNLTNKISLSSFSIIILIILPSITIVLIMFDDKIFDIISNNISYEVYRFIQLIK